MKCETEPLCQDAGFTLIEMMVALLIFSMLSVAGVLLLRSAVTSNEVTAEKLSEMATMQRFVSLMEADLNQAIARTYRDANGDRKAAFLGSTRTTGGDILDFARGGHSNINGAARSSLQRVVYRWGEGNIERLHSDMTDGAEIGPTSILLSGISGLNMRIRDKRGIWVDEWSPERLSDLPRAIELKFEQDGRIYRHVFLVGTGYL